MMLRSMLKIVQNFPLELLVPPPTLRGQHRSGRCSRMNWKRMCSWSVPNWFTRASMIIIEAISMIMISVHLHFVSYRVLIWFQNQNKIPRGFIHKACYSNGQSSRKKIRKQKSFFNTIFLLSWRHKKRSSKIYKMLKHKVKWLKFWTWRPETTIVCWQGKGMCLSKLSTRKKDTKKSEFNDSQCYSIKRKRI